MGHQGVRLTSRTSGIRHVKAFGYVRLSRDTDRSTSIDKQRASIESYCDMRNVNLVECFEDVDISGRKESRPSLDRMLERLDECDVIVFHRLDRIMRSVIGFAKLLERCRAAGVELVSATEPFDTSTAMGRAFVWLLASAAEIEAENTSERIKATRAHLARIGRPSHGARAFGRTKDQRTGQWVVVEAEAEILREVARLFLAGAGITGLCDGLNDGTLFGTPVATTRGAPWHPTSLTRMLKSPRMIGFQMHHGRPITSEPTLPPILDVDTYEAVRAELRRRTTWKERRRETDNELVGLVRCSICKGKMYVNHTAHKYGYTCRNHAGHSLRIPKLFLEAEVAKQMFDWMDERRAELDAERDALDEAEVDADPALRASLARLEWGREELMRDYYHAAAHDRDVFEQLLAETNEQIEQVREKLEWSHESGRRSIARAVRHDLRELWATMTPGQRRTVFTSCVERVVVYPAAYKGQHPTIDRFKVTFAS